MSGSIARKIHRWQVKHGKTNTREYRGPTDRPATKKPTPGRCASYKTVDVVSPTRDVPNWAKVNILNLTELKKRLKLT